MRPDTETEKIDVDEVVDGPDPGPVTDQDQDRGGRSRRIAWRHPDANLVVVLLLVVVGVRIGLSSLHDNSFLTHLATGRLILDTGSVPGHDPYSWTAPGHAWTVQSWGASVVYAGIERVTGLVGIRLFNTVCIVALILLLWRLTRPAKSLLARAVPVGIAVCMGTALWVERPLLFGAVGLALVLLAADDGLDPRWLVPVMWVWVNTHGSFPFGVGVLVLLAAGRWLDDRRRPVVELRALAWASVGTVLGGLNPIGPKILVFPLELLKRREAFTGVAEWEPPHFHRGVELFFAAQVVVALVLVLTRHRRWRVILPLVVFAAAAMTGTRNILQASIVFTPILAVAAAGLGSIDGERPHRLLRPVAAALVVLLALVTVFSLAEPDTRLEMYPVAATTYLRRNGMLDVDSRVLSRDYVGNYLEYRYGPEQARVFVDDRVDMYPLPVIRDLMSLLAPQRSYQPVLDRYQPTSVLWQRDTDFGRWLVHAKDLAGRLPGPQLDGGGPRRLRLVLGFGPDGLSSSGRSSKGGPLRRSFVHPHQLAVKQQAARRRQGERGASLIEYALLLALIAVVVFGAVSFFGSSAKGGFGKSTCSMKVAYQDQTALENCP